MKKVKLLVVITLLSFSNLFGQNYLNETSQWYEIQGDFFDRWIQFSNQQVLKDTVINGKNYFKIQQTYDYLIFSLSFDTLAYSQGSTLFWYLREDSSKLYRLQNGVDKLIVDFDLEVGDTIGNIWDFQIITEIDSFYFQNDFRRRYKTIYNDFIYEGIGGSKGIMNGVNYLGVEAFGVLKCYSQNGETIELYDDDWIGQFYISDTCKLLENIPTDISFVNPASKFKLYPNPFKTELKLEADEYIRSYRIFDSNGKLIKFSKGINQTIIDCDMSLENRGLYFIEIKTDSSVLIEKILKL